jgi:anti-sigma-K factor RskA
VTCDEVQQLLPSYVTGMLDADQAFAVRAHLATDCPSCTRALNETEAALELFTESLTPMEPPTHIKQKLMAAVGHTQATIAMPRSNRRILPYAMAACIGLIVGGFSIYFALPHPAPDRTQQLLAALADRDSHIEQLNRFIGSSNLNLVELSSEKSQAHGHILYDPDHHNWRLYVFDLAPPPSNRIYELWAITTDNKKLPAGTFTVDANGFAVFTGPMPDKVAAAAITDEPSPGVTVPTGSIHLLGKISG